MKSGQEITLKKRTVSSSFIETMLVVAQQNELDIPRICRDSGFSQILLKDPTSRVDEGVMFSLFEEIIRGSGNLDFGLVMGQQSRPGTYSGLGYAVMNCANLGDALSLIPRYEDVVMELGRTKIEFEGQRVKMIWGGPVGVLCPRALIDSILSSWLFLARWLTGVSARPDEVRFSYERPADTRLHHKLFGPNVHFSCSENAFVFSDGAILKEKILQADEEMNYLMTRRVKGLKEQLNTKNSDVAIVESTLRRLMPLGRVSLADVARDIGIGERTLRRRLSVGGSRFQDLLISLRHKLACEYLEDLGLSVLDIALLLGYTEHSSFTAAFKVWQGEAPMHYRKRVVISR